MVTAMVKSFNLHMFHSNDGCCNYFQMCRLPYDAVVDAEVANQYQPLHEEKCIVRPDHEKMIEAVRTQVSDLECCVTRLGENMEASRNGSKR